MRRVRSAPNINQQQRSSDGVLKAKPYPAHIFTDHAYEKMREDEKFRTMQRQIRQQALLSGARLPPRMETEADVHLKRKLKQVKGVECRNVI
jgi:hypothetical protein